MPGKNTKRFGAGKANAVNRRQSRHLRMNRRLREDGSEVPVFPVTVTKIEPSREAKS